MVIEELLKLSTFNCRGLGEGSKRRTVLNWLKKFHKGIIFLQETHSTESSERYWKSEFKGQIEFSHGKSSARGVATLISKDIDIIINEIIRDNTGRFLLLDTTFEGQTLILCNVYAPTKDDLDLQYKFIEFVQERLLEYSDKNLLIGGDFNICLDPAIDKKGGKHEKQSKCAKKLLDIMEEYNLIDIWRFLNYETRRFTRRDMSKCGLVQSRLDYWLISIHLLYDFNHQDIAPGLRSDHSIVKMSLNIKNSQEKGRGFFKFNSSLLRDTKYVKEVKEIIANYNKESNDENLGLKWDTLKSLIRGYTIGYATAKKEQTNKFEYELKTRLEILEKDLNENNYLEYSSIKKDLEQIHHEYALGVQLRSKAKHIEETEQNLSFFSKEETRNYNLRYIRTLLTNEETMVSDPKKIIEEE